MAKTMKPPSLKRRQHRKVEWIITFVLFSPTLGGILDDFITRQNINWSTERAFVWNIKSYFPLPLTSAALPCTTPQPPTAPLVSLPFPAGIRGGTVPRHAAAFSLLKERGRSCLPCRGRVQHTPPGSAVHFAPRLRALARRLPAPFSCRATATRSRHVSTTQNVLSLQKDLVLHPLILKELLLCSVRGYHLFAAPQSRVE